MSDNLKTKKPFLEPSSNNLDNDSKQITNNDCLDTDKVLTSGNNVDNSERISAHNFMDTNEVLTSENDVDDLDAPSSVLSQGVNKIRCGICNVTFTRKSNLRKHEKKFHSLDNAACNQVCGVCNSKCRTVQDLQTHIETEHPDVKLHFHEEVFYCQSDFDQWKAEIERQTVSSFILNYTRIKEDSQVLYYKCHRSGIYNPKPSESGTDKKKRHFKYAGSVKAGITCPAVIKATRETFQEATQITVKYQSTHVGHECEVRKLPLQKEERVLLANMLSSGIPISDVIERTQANSSPTERLGRTTRQDIYNVARDFNISCIVPKDEIVEKNGILKKKHKKNLMDLSGKKLVIEQSLKNISNKVQSLDSFVDLQYIEDTLRNIEAYLETTN